MHRFLRPQRVAASLALLTGLLALACAPASTSARNPSTVSAAGSAGAPAAGVTVTMLSDGDARKFEPASLSVAKGTTVTWKHVSGSGHTATSDPGKVKDASRVALPSGAQGWDSGTLSDGRTWSYTFDVPGTYQYVCLPHEDRGMVGTITVTGS
jgi:plastocyanin